MAEGFHQVIRNTWGKDVPADVYLRFFVGREVVPLGDFYVMKEDEISLDVDDDYDMLPHKTKGIVQWARDKYDHIFLCDTDTFLILERLMKCGFENYDYMGVIRYPLSAPFHYDSRNRKGEIFLLNQCMPWASGGIGYFLSNKAMRFVADAEITHWAEDLWIGQIMGEHYKNKDVKIKDAQDFEGVVSWHFPQARFQSQYDPKFGWMEEKYKEYGGQ
jgi:hypothetical protein